MVWWHCLKRQEFINAAITEGAEFKTRAFQSTLGLSNASAFSAHSVLKLRGIEILLKNLVVQFAETSVF